MSLLWWISPCSICSTKGSCRKKTNAFERAGGWLRKQSWYAVATVPTSTSDLSSSPSTYQMSTSPSCQSSSWRSKKLTLRGYSVISLISASFAISSMGKRRRTRLCLLCRDSARTALSENVAPEARFTIQLGDVALTFRYNMIFCWEFSFGCIHYKINPRSPQTGWRSELLRSLRRELGLLI
jgi:hypothetical protein